MMEFTNDDFYTRDDMAKKLKCSVRHFDTLVKNGNVPRPVSLGRLKRWSHSDIERWIQAGCPVLNEGMGE